MTYLKDKIDEGWSIQIYGRDRRLICSLYPSHGWTFLTGFLVGLFLALTLIGQSSNNVSATKDSHPTRTTPDLSEPLFKVE